MDSENVTPRKDEKVKITSSDSESGFLNDKITVDNTNLEKTVSGTPETMNVALKSSITIDEIKALGVDGLRKVFGNGKYYDEYSVISGINTFFVQRNPENNTYYVQEIDLDNSKAGISGMGTLDSTHFIGYALNNFFEGIFHATEDQNIPLQVLTNGLKVRFVLSNLTSSIVFHFEKTDDNEITLKVDESNNTKIKILNGAVAENISKTESK